MALYETVAFTYHVLGMRSIILVATIGNLGAVIFLNIFLGYLLNCMRNLEIELGTSYSSDSKSMGITIVLHNWHARRIVA